MKKALLPLLLLSGIASANADWTAVQTDPTHVTYTTTQTGSYTISDMGDAAIKDGESFTITMKFVCPSNPFIQFNGLSFVAAKAGSNADLYDINGHKDQFRVYLRPIDNCLILSLNGWTYGYGGDAQTDSTSYVTTLPQTGDISAENPVVLGFTLQYVAEGDNHFTFSTTEDSQVQIDPITDYNVVTSYNFTDLTNYTGNWVNAPADMVSTISITKAGVLPPAPSVPEPTTATLSLLALAGLAARRRRK